MDPESLRTLVLIVSIATLSPFISDVAKRRTRVPAVVIEIGSASFWVRTCSDGPSSTTRM